MEENVEKYLMKESDPYIFTFGSIWHNPSLLVRSQFKWLSKQDNTDDSANNIMLRSRYYSNTMLDLVLMKLNANSTVYKHMDTYTHGLRQVDIVKPL